MFYFGDGIEVVGHKSVIKAEDTEEVVEVEVTEALRWLYIADALDLVISYTDFPCLYNSGSEEVVPLFKPFALISLLSKRRKTAPLIKR
jgi:hypothetical protein